MTARDPRPLVAPARAAKTRGPKRGRPAGHFTQHRRMAKLRAALEDHPAGLSIADIAQLLSITTRSVRRYLTHLEKTVELEPVPTAPGRENLWRLKATERARALPLRRAPAYSLFAARGVFDPLRGSALYDALDLAHRQMVQIAARPARGPQQGEIRHDARLDDRWLHVAPPPHEYRVRAEDIDALFRAVADLHAVRFRHGAHGPRDPRAERVVAHPYALLLDRGALVLVALDVERSELRAFRFDRIADLAIDEDARFALPSELRASDFVHGAFGVACDAPSSRVLVEFDARVADEVRARKVHASQKVGTSSRDGRVRLEIVVPPSLLGEVARWVLSFGDAARALEPPELASDVAGALARAAARYT